MIKLDMSTPVGATSTLMSGLTAWASSGFLTDSRHLGLAITSALASSAATSVSSSKSNVQAESHIITPYANNVEQTK